MPKTRARTPKTQPLYRRHGFKPMLFVVMFALAGSLYWLYSQASANPLAGLALYRDPGNPAATQASQWRNSRPADAAQMDKISGQPQAHWMGDWTPNSQQSAGDYTVRAAAAGALGVIVAYNIPSRDCGSYSAGGAASHANYRSWIDGLTAGIGTRTTVVILEPDALPQLDCLDAAGKQARLDSLKYAIAKLKTAPGARIYLDAGNSGWLSAAEAASRLQQANVAAAHGFSLNVSNFYTTDQSTAYGADISGRIGGKHFVIDTSRNGLGHNGQWCNPSGRGLGEAPRTTTRHALADAYLWVKTPGESDGTCNGGPAAGVWWPDYALGLAQRAQLNLPAAPTPTPATPKPATPVPAPANKPATPPPAAATPSPVKPGTTPQPGGSPSTSGSGSRPTLPSTVSGTIALPPAQAGVPVSVSVDGHEVESENLDTRYLSNGAHEVTFTTYDEDGNPISTTTERIFVENKLHPLEKARNALFAPFTGDKRTINTVLFIGTIMAIIGVFVAARLWVFRPRDRNLPWSQL